ncbi:hydroxymethylglutaryl-coenzyme A reductase-domain-containing protein [Aspergillus desertorum]
MLAPQKLSSIASAHPIHTVVLISLLVSSAFTGPDTLWKWQDNVHTTASEVTANHRAIVTLEFDHGLPADIPISEFPRHLVESIDPSLLSGEADSVLSRLQPRSLSFSLAESDVSEFLRLIQDLPIKTPGTSPGNADYLPSYRWVVKPQHGLAQRTIIGLAGDKWDELVRLFYHAGPMEVAIMVIAYTAMHLTFASLFVSMYRLGSRFWLFASVLLSSTFAFVFALFTAIKLDIPVDLALLSEGLPFLVVVIGFENPIRLTQAVLIHAASTTPQGSGQQPTAAPSACIHTAIEMSLSHEGPRIFKYYAIQIALLFAGALFGVDAPVRQFCFLSAWILFFDCVLLFSFFIAILCIKLEILRLQSDGRQFRVDTLGVAMVITFILLNVLNASLIPFRTRTSIRPGTSGHSMWFPPRYVEYFPQVSGYLDSLLNEAKLGNRPISIALHPAVKLELQSLPPIDENDSARNPGSSSLLKSLEDPPCPQWKLLSAARNRRGNWNLSDSSVSGLPLSSSSSPVPDEPSRRPAGFNPVHSKSFVSSTVTRSAEECHRVLMDGHPQELTDDEVVSLSLHGQLPLHALEKCLKDFTRAIKIRRSIVSLVPFQEYDWSHVFGVCCENVVGYMPDPVGLAGPLGVLVAGVMRGSKAINAGGGVKTVSTADVMTRGPCVSFERLERTAEAKQWLDWPVGQAVMKAAFDSTTRCGRLLHMKTAMAGTSLYIRFKASTGDAMGMNMISKGVEHALNVMRAHGFTDMAVVSLSANYCSDKKPAAINWIDGRGKSVVAQATIPPDITNLIGSAMAGSVGGFNAHAANIVAAMYIATGQDPAQVVESANSITVMKINHLSVRGPLQVSVSMPSIEVGTIGGGTTLGPQRAMLDILGVDGANLEHPGENARQLARIVAAATLAGELSLCAALAAGHLVKAHMQHNRATQGKMKR